MLKGTNKQILEVINTESPYFERIVFFVRPEKASVPSDTLKKEAQSLSAKVKKPPKNKNAAKIIKGAVYIALGAGAGAALTYLMGCIA